MIYFRVEIDIPKDLMDGPCRKAELGLATDILNDTEKFVPMRSGLLSDTAQVDRVKREVVYSQGYAHYLYEGKVYVDPVFHTAGFLTDDGWKSRKNVKKIPTNKDLNIRKSSHPQAQSHWFEASKAVNKDKWVRGVAKIVRDELGR